MKYIFVLLVVVPQLALAVVAPSMTSMWMELLFLIVVLIVLKIANFPNKIKFILFGTYILSGIVTQTIWFPVLLFIGMYVYFHRNEDN